MHKIVNERRRGLLAGFWDFFLEAKTENTSPKARGEGLPCSNSSLISASRRFDPSHAIGD
jgi:hypothetical protein